MRKPKTFITTIRHLHSSGRWDRAAALLLSDLRQWVKQVVPHLITLTEVGDGQRGRILEQLAGFQRVQHAPAIGADECAVLFDTGMFELVDWESVAVSDRTYRRINGKQSPKFYALNVALRLREHPDEIIVVSVIHTPSSVETPRGWADGERPLVYRDVVHGWKRAVGVFARAVKAKERAAGRKVRVHRLLTGDFNLNMLKAWVRAYLGTVFGNLTQLWSKVRPNSGTHGARVIDTSWLSRGLRALKAKVLAQSPSSDHKAFWEDLAILPRRARR